MQKNSNFEEKKRSSSFNKGFKSAGFGNRGNNQTKGGFKKSGFNKDSSFKGGDFSDKRGDFGGKKSGFKGFNKTGFRKDFKSFGSESGDFKSKKFGNKGFKKNFGSKGDFKGNSRNSDVNFKNGFKKSFDSEFKPSFKKDFKSKFQGSSDGFREQCDTRGFGEKKPFTGAFKKFDNIKERKNFKRSFEKSGGSSEFKGGNQDEFGQENNFKRDFKSRDGFKSGFKRSFARDKFRSFERDRGQDFNKNDMESEENQTPKEKIKIDFKRSKRGAKVRPEKKWGDKNMKTTEFKKRLSTEDQDQISDINANTFDKNNTLTRNADEAIDIDSILDEDVKNYHKRLNAENAKRDTKTGGRKSTKDDMFGNNYKRGDKMDSEIQDAKKLKNSRKSIEQEDGEEETDNKLSDKGEKNT